jgi:hypothetical protein
MPVPRKRAEHFELCSKIAQILSIEERRVCLLGRKSMEPSKPSTGRPVDRPTFRIDASELEPEEVARIKDKALIDEVKKLVAPLHSKVVVDSEDPRLAVARERLRQKRRSTFRSLRKMLAEAKHAHEMGIDRVKSHDRIEEVQQKIARLEQRMKREIEKEVW